MVASASKTRTDFANFVKRKIWSYNVRATTRGQKPNRILLANKWTVEIVPTLGSKISPGSDFAALVKDYGDFQRVMFFDRKGTPVRNLLYAISKGVDN